MTIVKWMAVKNNRFSDNIECEDDDVLNFSEPIPYLKHLKQLRHTSNTPFLSCPAHANFYKNAFVITSPLTFSIKPNKHGNFSIECDEEDFEIINSYYLNRTCVNYPNQISGNIYMVSLLPLYCFVSENPVTLEILPLTFNPNLSLISGSYDISKWVRPMDFTVEFLNPYEKISFKKGDPLMCVRFLDFSGEVVFLEKNNEEEKTYNLIKNCLRNRNKAKDKTLDSYYKLGSTYINI